MRARAGLQEHIIHQLRVLLTGGERLFTNLTKGLERTDIPVTFLQFWAQERMWWTKTVLLNQPGHVH